MVHQDHGIARYDGIETITVGGAPHDCLRLAYDGGDKLFLPVENIEVLSRFGESLPFLAKVLAADEPLEIALYWHTWKVQSPRMEHLSRQIIEAAPKILARP